MGSMNMPLVCRMNQQKKWWHTLEMRGLSPAQEKSSVWFNVIPCYKRWSLLPSSAYFQRWPTRHPASPACEVCKPLLHWDTELISLPFNLGWSLALTAQIGQKRISNPDLQLAVCPSFLLEHPSLELKHQILRTSAQLHAEAHMGENWGPWSTDLTQLPANSQCQPPTCAWAILQFPFLHSPQRTAVPAAISWSRTAQLSPFSLQDSET